MHSENYKKKKIYLNSYIEHYVINIILKLQRAGFEAYLVGGAVRDILISKAPQDYDIATSATPTQIRRVFGKKRARIIGKRFKIVHLYCGREVIEISTFRKEPERNRQQIKDIDGCAFELKPLEHDNEYGTAYEDAWRRDFTVNSLFYDPVKKEVLDFTSKGLEDLEHGRVRIIGKPDIRFSEDPVRVLRALKLVGQYAFTLVEETEASLIESLPRILFVSKSRLTLELEKILRKPYASKIITTLHKYNFLKYFLPNLEKEWAEIESLHAMNLLEIRCNLLELGELPDYLTLSLSAIVIPYFNKQLSGAPENCVYEYNPEIRNIIKGIINYIFTPYSFPKYIVYAVTDIILLQSKIYRKLDADKTKKHPHFRTARELSIILNKYWWKDDSIIDFCKFHINKKSKYCNNQR